MATSALVDAGFLVALLSRRDTNHRWAAAAARRVLVSRRGAYLERAAEPLRGRVVGAKIAHA